MAYCPHCNHTWAQIATGDVRTCAVCWQRGKRDRDLTEEQQAKAEAEAELYRQQQMMGDWEIDLKVLKELKEAESDAMKALMVDGVRIIDLDD